MNPESPSQSFLLAGASALTKPNDVYQISPNFETYAHDLKLRTLEWRVLFAIDGYRTVREICKQLNLDEEQAREMFGKLSLLNLIQEEEISLADFLQRAPNTEIPALTYDAPTSRPPLALTRSGFQPTPPPPPVEEVAEVSDISEFDTVAEEPEAPYVAAAPPAPAPAPPPPIWRVEPSPAPAAEVVLPPTPAPVPPPVPVTVLAPSSIEVDVSAPPSIEPVEPPPPPVPVYVTPPPPPAPPPSMPPVFVPPIPSRPSETLVASAWSSPPAPATTTPVFSQPSQSPPTSAIQLPTPTPKPLVSKLSAPVPLVRVHQSPPTPLAPATPAPSPTPAPDTAGTIAPIRPLYGASPLPGTSSIPPIPPPPPPVPIALPRTGAIPLIIPPLPAVLPLTSPFPRVPTEASTSGAENVVPEAAPPSTASTPIPIQRLTTLPPLGRQLESTGAVPLTPTAPTPPASPVFPPPPYPPPPPATTVTPPPLPFLQHVTLPPERAEVTPLAVPAEPPAAPAMAEPEPPPPPPPAPPPPQQFRLGTVVDYINKQAGGGTLGQLATYRVLLQVPPELLRESGIRSFEFDGANDVDIKNPELQLALVAAIERTLNVQVPAGQFFR